MQVGIEALKGVACPQTYLLRVQYDATAEKPVIYKAQWVTGKPEPSQEMAYNGAKALGPWHLEKSPGLV